MLQHLCQCRIAAIYSRYVSPPGGNWRYSSLSGPTSPVPARRRGGGGIRQPPPYTPPQATQLFSVSCLASLLCTEASCLGSLTRLSVSQDQGTDLGCTGTTLKFGDMQCWGIPHSTGESRGSKRGTFPPLDRPGSWCPPEILLPTPFPRIRMSAPPR